MWHQWFNNNFMKLRESIFFCTKKTKLKNFIDQKTGIKTWLVKVIIFVFLAHKKVLLLFSTLRLNHWYHMDILTIERDPKRRYMLSMHYDWMSVSLSHILQMLWINFLTFLQEYTLYYFYPAILTELLPYTKSWKHFSTTLCATKLVWTRSCTLDDVYLL